MQVETALRSQNPKYTTQPMNIQEKNQEEEKTTPATCKAHLLGSPLS
jgi:hypothetical protein